MSFRSSRGITSLELGIILFFFLPVLLSAVTIGVVYRKKLELKNLAEDFSSRLELRTKKVMSDNQGFFVYDQFRKTSVQDFGDPTVSLIEGEGRASFTAGLKEAADRLNSSVRGILGCGTRVDCQGAYSIEVRYVSVSIDRINGGTAKHSAQASLFGGIEESTPEKYFEVRGFPAAFALFEGESFLEWKLKGYARSYSSEGARSGEIFPYAVPIGLHQLDTQRNYGFSEMAVEIANDYQRRAPRYARSTSVAGVAIQVDYSKLMEDSALYQLVFTNTEPESDVFRYFSLIPPRQVF